MTTTPALPELGDDRIAAMERELFARIADEAAPAPVAAPARRGPRRGSVWLGAFGGAAAAAVAILVAPAIVTGVAAVNQSGGAGSSVSGTAASGTAVDQGAVAEPAPAQAFSTDVATDASRQVIASGSATVRVSDIAAAVAAIGADAEGHGGYVESTSTDSGTPVPLDGGVVSDGPASSTAYGYVTVRVPADELADATSALSQVGEVTASAVSRQDVTDQTIDLQARVQSLQGSVDRLNALMAQAANVQDVIAVETELSARQADLESYRQQLQYLQSQVSLSSLSVTLVPDSVPVAADPAGFGDGLAAGWNGLVATLNGLVVAAGFLLPWIGVAAVVALVVWLIVRTSRRRRRATPVPAEPAE